MKKIRVKSPTRVDIAGGTVDLWPVNAILGGATTVNYAITVHSYVEIDILDDQKIIVDLKDVKFKKEYFGIVDLLNDQDPHVQLIRVFTDFFKPTSGFAIRTRSESPVGAGLGGSSSLCISLTQAFLRLTNAHMSTETIVELAHNLEAQPLGVPTGTQDYIPALLGGLCIIDYEQSGPRITKLSAPIEYIKQRSFLVYTGKPHNSGMNNWEVLKKFIERHPETVAALKSIRRKGIKARDICVKSEWDKLTEIFRESYELRLKLSPVFTSPEIERLKEVASSNGAQGVKICGAGGGGTVMIWSDPKSQEKVKTACQSAGFQILNAHATDQGSQIEVS